MPNTLFSNNIEEIKKFYKQNKNMIMKPINGYGGNQIHLIKNKFNKKLITNFLNKNGHSMFQKFLKNISKGDKRVFIINGKICGAISRVPKKGSYLSNMSKGAVPKLTKLTKQELKISKKIEENILKEVSSLAEIGGIQMIQYLQQEKKVNEVNFELKQIEAKIKEINFDKKKTIITSPVKGKVFNLIPQSVGYASTLGENLMNIVPDGEVEAKVFLSNNDVGFLRKEMEADIRIDAYPFTQFGSIKGNLKFVGDEVLPSDYQNPEPRFPAYINLSKQYLNKNGNTYSY